MSEYKTMIATVFNMLPVKSVVSTWTRRGEVYCDNRRERKRKTIKHLFYSCKYPFYEAISTKKHDKVVSELYCWVKLCAEKVIWEGWTLFRYGWRRIRGECRMIMR